MKLQKDRGSSFRVVVKGGKTMPDGRTMLILAAIAGVMYVGDKVVHFKPIQKTNHALCRVATFGKKCKPPAQSAQPDQKGNEQTPSSK